MGSPATASAVSFAIAGSTSTATTAAPRAAMSDVKAPVPDPTSRITSFEPTLGRVDDQVMNIQVDQKVLTQPALGRNPMPARTGSGGTTGFVGLAAWTRLIEFSL